MPYRALPVPADSRMGGMRLLVLGGTAFVGRAVVGAALGQGWDVTTFNRGRSGDDVAGVAPDRSGGCPSLGGELVDEFVAVGGEQDVVEL